MKRTRRAPHAGLNGSRGRSFAVAAHEPPLKAVVASAAPAWHSNWEAPQVRAS